MNTSQNKFDSIEALIFKQGLKIKDVSFNTTRSKMLVHLTNEVTLVVPTKLYARLKNAPAKKILNFRLSANGSGIHWPDLDEDLSLKGFFNDFLKQSLREGKELVIAA
jgi:hypothetical protein